MKMGDITSNGVAGSTKTTTLSALCYIFLVTRSCRCNGSARSAINLLNVLAPPREVRYETTCGGVEILLGGDPAQAEVSQVGARTI